MGRFFSIEFFFFKQKTAYEMRISDWSSDVCSSDLVRFGPANEDSTSPISELPVPRVHIALSSFEAPALPPPPAAPELVDPPLRIGGRVQAPELLVRDRKSVV